MGEIDTIVEDSGFTEDHVICTDSVSLLGIFSPIEPGEVADGRAVSEVGDDALFTRSHGEGLETENLSYNLNIGHVARQFVDGVDLRAVNIFIRIVF